MPIPSEATLYLALYCVFFSGVILAIGLENRFPLVPVAPIRKRLRHFGRNAGVWLFTLFLVDWGITPHLHGQSLAGTMAGRGLLAGLDLGGVGLFVAGFLLLDLFEYLVHYLSHRVGWIWRFHAVHHSDPAVDVSTTLRQHPGEALLNAVARFAFLLLLGVPVWLALLRDVIKLPLGLLHHGNVAIPERVDRALRWVFVTPGLHKIHHSPHRPETDSNYGFFFSFWDRMFGTLVHRHAPEHARYGLAALAGERWQGIPGMLRTPFAIRAGQTL